MSLKVCFLYQWATLGGVERVFLNRAQALDAGRRDVEIDVHYGSDGGGLAAFTHAVRKMRLERRLRVVPRFDPSQYDAVFAIDSPELLPDPLPRSTVWVNECHTPYQANRRYLRALPEGIEQVLVPSRTFAKLLREEQPEIAHRIRLLRNSVSPAHRDSVPVLPEWRQVPLLYFGRLDGLKNPQGFIDLFGELERRAPSKYFGLALGPEAEGYRIGERIDIAGARGKIIQMPPVSFLKTAELLAGWRGRRGVMVSPSFGESFGLAAAESIAAGIPVLLSHLPEHAELVGGDERHLYDPADVESGADKIEAMLAEYDASSQRMRHCSAAFNTRSFLSDWDDLMDELGLVPARAPDQGGGA